MGEPADSLYVAPRQDDIHMSLAARLVADQAEGRRTVLVGLFDEASLGTREADAALDGLLGGPPPTRVRLGLSPDAPDVLLHATEALSDLRYRTRAGDLYMPLGVGNDLGRRIAHEAALHAYGNGEGRNVFLYEERPEAFVPGAVRMRLGHIGARLPPGAAESADDTSLAAFLLRYHIPPSLRGDLKGLGERARGIKNAARRWREARSWRPGKGFGPRLHPILHQTPDALLAAVTDMVGDAAASPRAAERMTALATRYARRLGARGHAERLWLLLPPATHGRITPVDAPEVDAAAS